MTVKEFLLAGISLAHDYDLWTMCTIEIIDHDLESLYKSNLEGFDEIAKAISEELANRKIHSYMKNDRRNTYLVILEEVK